MKYFIGVDGGGTGTRIRVWDQNLSQIAEARGPSSALAQGISEAWRAIMTTLSKAFSDASLSVPSVKDCSIGMGLSGANNLYWKNEFLLMNPGFKKIVVESDGLTTLLGAHQGAPGVIIALGTGSVGMSKNANGEIHSVSGWGYPSGDEASGSWLGIQVLRYTEKVMDGRRPSSPLSVAVKNICGSSPDNLLDWLGRAHSKEYATLAPLIFEHLHHDAFAKELVNLALADIEEMLVALDPQKTLPFSLCGSLGHRFVAELPNHLKSRHSVAKGDSADGALTLIKGEEA